MRIDPLRPQMPNSNMQSFPLQQNHQPMPRVLKWCSIEKKYTNHETRKCYFRPRYENQQLGGQQQQPPPIFRRQGYGRGQMEKPPLVLGQQPPLLDPNLEIVNFSQPKENVLEKM